MTANALGSLEEIYRHWLRVEDTYPLRVTLGGYAANLLPGEPVWPALVGGSGYGKTETLNIISALPKVRAVSTLTSEAALLSGTPRKDHGKGAVGGVLAEIGSHGILVLKDFTSILGKRHEDRASILGALRECFDGSWVRDVGAEGGTKLAWSGKLGLITGCTSALDRAHAVMALMGERFVIARMSDADRKTIATAALDNRGREQVMRRQLADAATLLFDAAPPAVLPELSAEHRELLIAAADVIALSRSPVERDYKGEIDLVLDPEAPTRLIKSLAQLHAGLVVIGFTEAEAWPTVARVALDCAPKLRRKCMEAMLILPNASTGVLAEKVEHPTSTTRRALEDLVAHGVANREVGGEGRADRWELTERANRTVTSLREASRLLDKEST